MTQKAFAETRPLKALDLLDITSMVSQEDFAGKGCQGAPGFMEKLILKGNLVVSFCISL